MTLQWQQLRKLAPILDKLPVDPQARVYYEFMADALIWSDELPPTEQREGLDTTCLRGVFRYRTSLLLGHPEDKFRPPWEEALALFPHWPGFLPDRQGATLARIQLYEENRAKLLVAWENLDARFANSQATNAPVATA